MAGFKDTLQKLIPDTIKMKRHLSSDEEASAQKPAKKLAAGSPNKKLVAKKSPSSTTKRGSHGDEDGTMDNSPAYTYATRSTSRQSKHSNKIAGGSTPSTPNSGFSDLSNLQSDTSSDLWMNNPSPTGHDQRQIQIDTDETIARELQEQFDRDGDGDTAITSSTHPGNITIPNYEARQLPSTDETVQNLRAYGNSLQKRKCQSCNRSFLKLMQGGEAVKRTKQMFKDGVLHPCVKCRHCVAFSCIGCGKNHESVAKLPRSSGSYKSGKGFKVAWCCDEGREYLVWCLAGGLEYKEPDNDSSGLPYVYDRLRPRKKPSSENNSAATSPAPSSGAPPASSSKFKKIKVESGVAKGTGYGGHGNYMPGGMYAEAREKLTPRKVLKSTSAEEELLWHYLRALALILPTLNGDNLTTFDSDSHDRLSLFIARSPLLKHASDILLSGSIIELEDKTREDEFLAAVNFVFALCNHPATYSAVTNPVVRYPENQLLFRVSLSKETSNKECPTGKSIEEIITDLAEPLKTYTSMALKRKEAGKDDATTEVPEIYHTICSIADYLATNAAPSRGSSTPETPASDPKGKGKAPALSPEEQAKQAKEECKAWSKENSMVEIPEDVLLECFYFKDRAERLAKDGGANTHRMGKLMKQMATLRKDLPDGIFVRYSQTLLGAMKIIIVGPEGTPYENGLFEFDLFCDAKFPEVPPQMQFRTTAAGKVGFNPNLYNTGKICLSLLGTWSGEPWAPNKSTLLQVLVSIQAFILCKEPWYNEPGREQSRNKAASNTYNNQIEQHTINHAIIYWLKERLAKPAGAESSPKTKSPPVKSRSPKKSIGVYDIDKVMQQYLNKKAQAKGPSSSPQPKKGMSKSSLLDEEDKDVAMQVKKFVPLVPPPPPPASAGATGFTAPWSLFGPHSHPPVAAAGTSSNSPAPAATASTASTGTQTAAGISNAGSTFPTSTEELYKAVNKHFGYPENAPNPDGHHIFMFLASTSPSNDSPEQGEFFNQAMALATDLISSSGSLSAGSHWDMMDAMGPGFDDEDEYIGHAARVPEGNTAKDGDDDHVWGELIRRHFGARARDILDHTKTWGKGKGASSTWESLKEAFEQYGFVETPYLSDT